MSTALREKVFISYSHRDKPWLDAFQRMLKPAVEADILDLWSDHRIDAGTRWQQEIERALDSAQVALLLVSDSFLESDFIARHELPRILSAAQNRGLIVFWVPLTPALHELSPLASLQASWDPNRPLIGLDEAGRAEAIRVICWDICSRLGQLSRVSSQERDSLREALTKVLPARITLGEPIGSGHHSIVYKARRGDETIAVKVLVDSPLHERAIRYDIDEHIRVATSLKHPVFVTIHDVFTEAPPHCIVMEHMSCVTLAQTLQVWGTLPVDEVARIIRQLGEGLSEAHERGLVQGILNPSNVFLDGGRPRLSAFGFWKYLASQESLAGNMLMSRESVSYLTPEHFYGHPVGPATDQYALALLAYELVQGQRPVTVRCPADLAYKRDFFFDPLATAGAWAERHPAFARILARMLAEDPAERWPSMAMAIDALAGLEHEYVAIAKGSYLRTCYSNDVFYARFYERLFERCPQIRGMFSGRDMQAQFRLLDSAVQSLLNFRGEAVVEPTVLTATADRHKALALDAEHFQQFSSALLDTIDELTADPAIVSAWASTIRPGIEYMVRRCVPKTRTLATFVEQGRQRSADADRSSLALSGTTASGPDEPRNPQSHNPDPAISDPLVV
ncbi:MAG: protein kinase [Gammaproteobacteria bacterium]|nr:protein kinase [Gammaproteobacteria bacterium]